MLLVSVAGANAAGAPAAAVPLLPAELSTLVTAAIRNHPAARSAQAKRRAVPTSTSTMATPAATTESQSSLSGPTVIADHATVLPAWLFVLVTPSASF